MAPTIAAADSGTLVAGLGRELFEGGVDGRQGNVVGIGDSLGLLGLLHRGLLLLTRRALGRTNTRLGAVDSGVGGKRDVGGGAHAERSIVVVGAHGEAGRTIALTVGIVAVSVGIEGSFGVGGQIGFAVDQVLLLAGRVLGLDLVTIETLDADAFSSCL